MENEVGRTCGTHGRGEKSVHCFGIPMEIPMERDHSEDRGVDGRMGSELLLAGGGDGVH
jgi:hypothetical protein